MMAVFGFQPSDFSFDAFPVAAHWVCKNRRDLWEWVAGIFCRSIYERNGSLSVNAKNLKTHTDVVTALILSVFSSTWCVGQRARFHCGLFVGCSQCLNIWNDVHYAPIIKHVSYLLIMWVSCCQMWQDAAVLRVHVRVYGAVYIPV